MTRLWASISMIDLGLLVDVCQALQEAGVDGIHVDISDGAFTPDLTFGSRVIAALTPRIAIPVEAHLMINNPEARLSEIANAGAARASFHIEATPYPWRVIELGRELSLTTGVALNPVTPLECVKYLVSGVDFVNILTTEPDGHDEKLLPEMVQRVRDAHDVLDSRIPLQVDGGLNQSNVTAFTDAGASELVVGRAFVHATELTRTVDLFRQLTRASERS